MYVYRKLPWFEKASWFRVELSRTISVVEYKKGEVGSMSGVNMQAYAVHLHLFLETSCNLITTLSG